MAKLTIKQEKFCQLYIENGGNATEAYRGAYNTENMKPETIHVKACELLKSDKVAVRIKELQEMQVEEHLDTVDSIATMLREDRLAARAKGQFSAAVSATMGLAKLRGFLIDKKEDVTARRTNEQINARILELLGPGGKGGAARAVGGKGADQEGDETVPTVPGHGTA